MALIINSLSISYKFLAPHPFDEKLFIKKIEDTFSYKTDVVAVNVDETGHIISKPKPVYVAKDGTSELNFTPEIGIVGVKGDDFNEVNTNFNQIKKILETDMGVNFKMELVVPAKLSKF